MVDKVPDDNTAGDIVYGGVKGLIGTVPWIGAIASEMFGIAVTPPTAKRMRKWLESVAEDVRKLKDFNSLSDNPLFQNAVMKSYRIVQTTSQQGKLDALRNAILNSVVHPDMDASKHEMFLGLVEDLTEAHLKLLHLVSDPIQWFKSQNRPVPQFGFSSSLSGLITAAYPDLSNEMEFVTVIWKDLWSRQLVGPESLQAMLSADAALVRQTTNRGGEFLAFITEPKEVNS